MDNSTAHSLDGTTLRNIQVEFLPENTTSILQPCDQGIIRAAKAYFCKALARTVLRCIDEGSRATALDITKKISLLDGLVMLHNALADVEASTIRNCQRKGGLVMSGEEEPAIMTPPARITSEEFEE